MVHHARYENVTISDTTIVESIIKDGKMFRLTTSTGQYLTKTVILAIGMGLFEPKRLGVPGEVEFEDKGVAYAIPNLDIYRGQNVLVVGGGDTGVENAIMLSRVAKVTLIHRREAFRAVEANLEILSRSLAELRFNTELKEIRGDGWVKKVVLYNNKEDRTYEMDVDGVVINIGFSLNLNLVESAGVKNDGDHILIDAPNMNTNVKGIFACGDIVEYPGKVRQILPGVGEGVTAAEEAYKYIKSSYWANK
jgi:thioredoxin reductase